jgi:hypothetical protein
VVNGRTMCQQHLAMNAQQVKAYRQRYPSRAKDSHLRRGFGITIEDYTALLSKQNGVCAICKKPPVIKALAVDHKHGTTLIRGLLCDTCNRGLGQFFDNPALLQQAAIYIQEAECQP